MDFQQRSASAQAHHHTRHILFIVSGAFTELAERVRRRLQSGQIGFAAGRDSPPNDADLLQQAQSRDFIDYGMEPEFVGRLPVRVACPGAHPPRISKKILLTSEGSILQQYRADFSGYGIDFEITRRPCRRSPSRLTPNRPGPAAS